ncbi:MAG: YfhO family protein [Eubacteriales bacterium]|nr:YfhO family protein [Eubacteriales bacterium]
MGFDLQERLAVMTKIKSGFKDFHMGKEKKTQILLLGALFFSCLFIFRNYIFGNEIMVFNDIGEDTWQLYTMHYAGIVNHLREGTFSLWDFTNGFGTNMFNLNLFDPSIILLCLLGVFLGPAHMLIYLVWLQILKILIAGWVFYRFLSLFSFSTQAKFLAAFAYGLNGYLMIWGQHYQFGMVTIYFPLMLLFCEKLVRREKGRGWFPVIVFLSGIYSVYFTYMSLAGIGIYLLFRVLMLEGLSGKERVRRFLGGCAQILLGLGMSFAVFLPMASVLLNVSARMDGGSGGVLGYLKQYLTLYPGEFYESVLMRLFSTNLQTVHSLGDGKFETLWNYYEDPIFFCSAMSVMLNVQFLIVFRKVKAPRRTKTAVYAAAALMALTVLLPLGGSVFNAFNIPTNRYTFVLIPFFLLVTAWMWDYLRTGGRICWLALLIVFLAQNKVAHLGYDQSVFSEYRTNAVVLAVTGEIAVLCLGAMMVLKSTHSRKALLGIMAAVMVVNVISESGTGYEDRITLRKRDTPLEEMGEQLEKYKEESTSLDSEETARASLIIPQTYFRELYRQDLQDALAYLRENDKEFYRVEKDFMSATFAMDSLAQGYRGISTYNSVMNKNMKDFVDVCYPELYYKDHNHYAFWDNGEDNWFAAFTGVRYLISGNKELDPSKYRMVKQFGGIYLYENVLESNTAKFYNTGISEKSFRNLCTKESREELLNSVIALEGGSEVPDMEAVRKLKEDGGQQKASAVTLDAPVKDSLVTGRIEAAEDGYVMFLIPFEDGWSLTVDGEETELIKGNLGFLSCRVQEGDHDLVLTFRAPLLKEGIWLSCVFWLIFAVWQLYRHKRKKTGKS